MSAEKSLAAVVDPDKEIPELVTFEADPTAAAPKTQITLYKQVDASVRAQNMFIAMHHLVVFYDQRFRFMHRTVDLQHGERWHVPSLHHHAHQDICQHRPQTWQGGHNNGEGTEGAWVMSNLTVARHMKPEHQVFPDAPGAHRMRPRLCKSGIREILMGNLVSKSGNSAPNLSGGPEEPTVGHSWPNLDGGNARIGAFLIPREIGDGSNGSEEPTVGHSWPNLDGDNEKIGEDWEVVNCLVSYEGRDSDVIHAWLNLDREMRLARNTCWVKEQSRRFSCMDRLPTSPPFSLYRRDNFQNNMAYRRNSRNTPGIGVGGDNLLRHTLTRLARENPRVGGGSEHVADGDHLRGPPSSILQLGQLASDAEDDAAARDVFAGRGRGPNDLAARLEAVHGRIRAMPTVSPEVHNRLQRALSLTPVQMVAERRQRARGDRKNTVSPLYRRLARKERAYPGGARELREEPLTLAKICGLMALGPTFRVSLETDWKCPVCSVHMLRAPFRHEAEEAFLKAEYPDWQDNSTVEYKWDGLCFPKLVSIIPVEDSP
ncbi:hypothetical protein DFH07DRAFT_769905 [Mycena maculata]|uniref:Uncharacterized protein n=1 Tax=Mycena maculata TaxID=230809 RepID=A0AAD7JJV6_9AGAR|nr:hypothetical protein DFH07DRAFT_769905 [Mycena maculata]